MKFRRLVTLIGKEIRQNATNFFFPFALAVPVVFTLVVTLLFGNLFIDKPKMAILDAGDSSLVADFAAMDSLIVKEYSEEIELKQAVETGVADVGLLLPAGFDELVKQGELATIDVFVWGGSLIKHRASIASAIAVLFQDLAGKTLPLEIQTVLVGDEVNIPWEDRLLPFIIIVAVLLGGMMIPATSLVDEKQKRTIKALAITPSTFGEVFFAKGFFGFIVSLMMGIITLAMNRAFGVEPGLLILVMSLGGIMATVFGLFLGAVMKDLNAMFAVMKSLGIFIYAPAILYLFPSIPEWISKVFPTYYMIHPVIEITQNGGGWAEIALDVYVMLGIVAVLVALVNWAGNRLKLRLV